MKLRSVNAGSNRVTIMEWLLRHKNELAEKPLEYAITVHFNKSHWIGMVTCFQSGSVFYIDPLDGERCKYPLDNLSVYINILGSLAFGKKVTVGKNCFLSDNKQFCCKRDPFNCGIYDCTQICFLILHKGLTPTNVDAELERKSFLISILRRKL